MSVSMDSPTRSWCASGWQGRSHMGRSCLKDLTITTHGRQPLPAAPPSPSSSFWLRSRSQLRPSDGTARHYFDRRGLEAAALAIARAPAARIACASTARRSESGAREARERRARGARGAPVGRQSCPVGAARGEAESRGPRPTARSAWDLENCGFPSNSGAGCTQLGLRSASIQAIK